LFVDVLFHPGEVIGAFADNTLVGGLREVKSRFRFGQSFLEAACDERKPTHKNTGLLRQEIGQCWFLRKAEALDAVQDSFVRNFKKFFKIKTRILAESGAKEILKFVNLVSQVVIVCLDFSFPAGEVGVALRFFDKVLLFSSSPLLPFCLANSNALGALHFARHFDHCREKASRHVFRTGELLLVAN
jgi:hypothetical protein